MRQLKKKKKTLECIYSLLERERERDGVYNVKERKEGGGAGAQGAAKPQVDWQTKESLSGSRVPVARSCSLRQQQREWKVRVLV